MQGLFRKSVWVLVPFIGTTFLLGLAGAHSLEDLSTSSSLPFLLNTLAGPDQPGAPGGIGVGSSLGFILNTLVGRRGNIALGESNSFILDTRGVYGKKLDGIYVAVTVHGQIMEAFWTKDASTLRAPSWLNDAQTKLSSLVADINRERTSAEKGSILFVGKPVDWAQATHSGIPLIASGRMLELAWSLGGLARVDRLVKGLLYQASGKQLTSAASRAAAKQAATSLAGTVSRLKASYPNTPVFIDFIGHSRGGAVSSQTIRDFYSLGSFPGVGVSFTVLDGIDPTDGGLRTLAGNMLGDPEIEKGKEKRISNFYADRAMLTLDYHRIWWGNLLLWVNVHFGLELLDATLIVNGAPKGRSRPELSPERDLL
ncbi:MAG TPA: hypothetical protein PKH07_10900, partial [bacterium]|nr:hypothetical protein [bacterium]